MDFVFKNLFKIYSTLKFGFRWNHLQWSKFLLNGKTDIFTLIEGEFSPKESRELLFSVFKSKIRFHRLKNFSSQERLGKNDENALSRMVQLQETLASIFKVIDSAEKENQILEIRADIVLSFSNSAQ